MLEAALSHLGEAIPRLKGNGARAVSGASIARGLRGDLPLPSMMLRPSLRTALAGLLAGSVLLFGCKKKEPPPPPPAEVLVTPAAARDVPVFKEWIATLDGSENADIRARITGNVISRRYQEGAFVKKGDLLFEIDPRAYVAALAQAKGDLEQGKANQAATEADARRNTELFEKKVISEQEYTNKVQSNAANAEKVAALTAAVRQAQLNLEFCRITAPIDGIAGVAKAQVGDLVSPTGTTPLAQVSTVDPIKIIFPVSEAEYLEAFQQAQELMALPLEQRPEKLELFLADGTVFPRKARLLSLDRDVKSSTGTILVTGLMANPSNVLRPGFFARARVEASVLKGAVVVPQRAVTEVQATYQVVVVGGDGKAEVRVVKVGARTGPDWVITAGLKAGESVVVEGVSKVRNGMPVVPKPWTPPKENPKDKEPPKEAPKEAKEPAAAPGAN